MNSIDMVCLPFWELGTVQTTYMAKLAMTSWGKFKPVHSLSCAFPQHIMRARVRIIPYIPYRTVPYIRQNLR